MEYVELVFEIIEGADYQRDLFIDALAESGFDTFEETAGGFNAYMRADVFDKAEVERIAGEFSAAGFRCSFVVRLIASKNWNEVWESNFEPLLIGGECYVRATFHPPRPEYPYEIVIDPKMAFGTGHHETTSLMIEYLLKEDLGGKKVLDMGCGTAILGILAMKAGAAQVTAIDNDPLCYESSVENSRLNGTGNIRCICGSAESIPGEQFDVLVANINRNILLGQLDRYAKALTPGGTLLMSGFYETPDLDMVASKALSLGLRLAGFKKSRDWVAARFT